MGATNKTDSDALFRFFSRIGIIGVQARTIGENSLSVLEYWYPDLASEIEAIALGTDLPVWYLASLNTRTKILSTKSTSYLSECSTAIYAAADINMPQTVQTWDWHDVLAPNGLMIQLQDKKGMQFKLLTEFGMLGKIGVNSTGLDLHFNILHHTSDNDSGGVSVHAVAHRILEEATTIEEAIALAFSAQVSVSSVLSVFCHHAARC
ncbi:MAG TPA: C45 family autoproteolytic acyltransferase/hydrolase [Arsenophonus sp.]